MFKKLVYYFALLVYGAEAKSQAKLRPESAALPTQSFYSFKIKTLDGKDFDMASLKGKKVLLVNTASECGYTPQYASLEKLHEQYGSKVVIIGFPANNFGAQEPGSNQEIATFCQRNYGVSFMMAEKIDVVGEKQAPLYQWLSKKELNGWNDQAPKWNFCKYLVNEEGQLIGFYPSAIKPMDKEIVGAL